jgi:hypothetical protein
MMQIYIHSQHPNRINGHLLTKNAQHLKKLGVHSGVVITVEICLPQQVTHYFCFVNTHAFLVV